MGGFDFDRLCGWLCEVFDGYGEGAAVGLEGFAVEESCDFVGRDGCGHDDDFQVIADLLEVFQEGDGQVCVEAAFVEFVEDDDVDAFEEWVALQASGEDSFGDDAQTSVFGGAVVEADLVADFLAKRSISFAGDAFGGGAGGDAAWFEQETKAGARESGVEEGGWDAGAFSGAGRSLQHEVIVVLQVFDDGGQKRVDGKIFVQE